MPGAPSGASAWFGARFPHHQAPASAIFAGTGPGPGGWHRDAPSFGVVVGVSLGSSARLRFRRGSTGHWTTREVDLPPRSAHVLAGEARTKWQHSIPPTKALRYSITFRTLKGR